MYHKLHDDLFMNYFGLVQPHLYFQFMVDKQKQPSPDNKEYKKFDFYLKLVMLR